MAKALKLDPAGYFLIRTRNGKIEIGFCSYNDMVLGKSNKVLKRFSSGTPGEIINWVARNKLYSQKSHLVYLRRELEKAAKCIGTGKDYVQG